MIRAEEEDGMLQPVARCFAFLVAALMVAATAAFGQAVGASLQGIITDPSGAPVPNASITVIGVATGGVWELTTDSTGHYRAPLLQPGAYEVHV
jgi:protocatechuate 3,4-dioxygenase beta subunit